MNEKGKHDGNRKDILKKLNPYLVQWIEFSSHKHIFTTIHSDYLQEIHKYDTMSRMTFRTFNMTHLQLQHSLLKLHPFSASLNLCVSCQRAQGKVVLCIWLAHTVAERGEVLREAVRWAAVWRDSSSFPQGQSTLTAPDTQLA